jgi:shikimate dehydrogenase
MAEPKAFVCGYPIAHSRSPMIHGYWLKRYGLAGGYIALDVAPEAFAGFLGDLAASGYRGGNVTIPHKEAAFRHVRRRGEAAEEIGAVNALWFENGELWGGNTDSEGFAANLDEFAPGWDKTKVAVVLGAGGAALAVVHALKHRGFTAIRVVNRTVARAVELAHRFGSSVSAHGQEAVPELLADTGLLVNTTSVGMHEDTLAADPTPLPDHAVVTDIVYVPLETPLLAAARRRGLMTVDGLGMLLHQAVPGFERWFGRRPEVTPELRSLLVADISRPK